MKSGQAVKPDPPARDVAGDYAEALTAWRAVNTKMCSLRAEIDRRRLALTFAGQSEIPERSKHIAATVADLIAATRRSPLRAASDLEGLEFDATELQPRHIAAHETYTIARNVLASEIAMTFRDRHLTATKKVIVAIEALSAALQMERDVRHDFSSVSPEPSSHLLPDISRDLRDMDLASWDSIASVWARRIRKLGVVT
jgi:hypothetical protein